MRVMAASLFLGHCERIAYHGPGERGIRTSMLALQSALGVIALPGFAFLISEDRGAVSWKRAALGLAVTLGLAALFLKVPPVTAAFGAVNSMVDAIAAA